MMSFHLVPEYPVVRARFVLLLVISWWMGAADASAQSSGLSTNLLFRSEAAAVAGQAVARLHEVAHGVDRVGVEVVGGTAPVLMENAMVEALANQGYRPFLGASLHAADPSVQIAVLDQGVHYELLPSGEYRRVVQTAIEGRYVSRDTSGTMFLGAFHHADVDTVAFREEGGLRGFVDTGERNFFDRLLGPILMVSGAFLIVYLFFTVRN